MADDNPIAQSDPTSLGNQHPQDNYTNDTPNQPGAHDHHQEHQRPSPSNSTSAKAIADPSFMTASSPTTSAAANPKHILSFATETETAAYNEQGDAEIHNETNVDIPIALTGVVPSTVEGYSIYSNIKDGKVHNPLWDFANCPKHLTFFYALNRDNLYDVRH